MPRHELPEDLKASLADPIVFSLNGKEFDIPKVTTKMAQKLSAVQKWDNPIDEFLAAIIGEKEYKALGDIDVREAASVVKWINEILGSGLSDEEKNAASHLAASPEPSQDSSDTPT